MPLPRLAELMRDRDASVANQAVWSLTLIGKAAVPKLVEALQGEDQRNRVWAAGALGQIGPDADSAGPALVPAQEIGPASMLVVDPLLRALHDDSERVRDVAAQGLGGVGPPAVPGLIKAWDDPDRRMRLRVIKVLSIIRPISGETVSAMIKSLADPDEEVSHQAVMILGTMGPEAAPRSPAACVPAP